MKEGEGYHDELHDALKERDSYHGEIHILVTERDELDKMLHEKEGLLGKLGDELYKTNQDKDNQIRDKDKVATKANSLEQNLRDL